MRHSSAGILTTHVGSLPVPPGLWGEGGADDARLAEAVAQVVRRQKEIGIDIVNEGELTKQGSWASFMRRRVQGFEPDPERQASFETDLSVDRIEFAEFYRAAVEKGTLFEQTGTARISTDKEDHRPLICTGPVTYVGQAALRREIDLLLASLGDTPASDAFLTTVAPASFEPGVSNRHYAGEEEFLIGLADALAVEYEMIADAGLIVQVDDAFIPALWETIGVKIGLEAYRRYIGLRIEATNHALRNVPSSQVRYHLCWGSWHGPHAHDLPLADIVDLLLRVNADAYLIESANVRHEHEWRVWQEVKLPPGKILMPGVVSHATTLIEHPDLVADRILRFARLLGAENVVASTDCGLGARCHPQIAWAKLDALVKGARQASLQLFG